MKQVVVETSLNQSPYFSSNERSEDKEKAPSVHGAPPHTPGTRNQELMGNTIGTLRDTEKPGGFSPRICRENTAAQRQTTPSTSLSADTTVPTQQGKNRQTRVPKTKTKRSPTPCGPDSGPFRNRKTQRQHRYASPYRGVMTPGPPGPQHYKQKE